MDYRISEDIELMQELLSVSRRELSRKLDISVMTLNRWAQKTSTPFERSLEKFYAFAYDQGIRLTQIKTQLYLEDCDAQHSKVVFHGSKAGIEGAVDIQHSRKGSDFGAGFYCGESFEQSALFVAQFPRSSVYAFSFDSTGLREARFQVDQEWMLAIAYYRGRLNEYADHPLVQTIRQRVHESDYVIAPIADNRMFEIIDNFIDGEITDEQCRHCLSATQLGNQFVFTTSAALGRLTLLEHCYLCKPERDQYLHRRHQDWEMSADKVKVARRTYRGKGHYIEEVLS